VLSLTLHRQTGPLNKAQRENYQMAISSGLIQVAMEAVPQRKTSSTKFSP
jgi:hypothetical protein